mgnify:CR=1 FL=1
MNPMFTAEAVLRQKYELSILSKKENPMFTAEAVLRLFKQYKKLSLNCRILCLLRKRY